MTFVSESKVNFPKQTSQTGFAYPKEYCGKWTWRNLETGEVAQAFCGCMSCPRARCKKAFWKARVELLSDLISEYNLKKFFTLTLDRDKIDVGVNPWKYIHKPWKSFRRVVIRKYSEFLFAAVLESHKNENFPHVHGFTNIWMSQADWSRHWSACGGGKVVWVERVKDEKASDYVSKQINVAKYVGKEQLVEAYANRDKRRIFWRSAGMKTSAEMNPVGSPWLLEFREWKNARIQRTGRPDNRRKDS